MASTASSMSAASHASGAQATSRIERLLQAKESLPSLRKQIFDSIYRHGRAMNEVATELGLSVDDLDREHSAMLRSLRGAAVNG